VFYECKNKSDFNVFYQDLLEVVIEEFTLAIDRTVNASELVEEDLDESLYTKYLIALKENREFMENIYISILERNVSEEFDIAVEKGPLIDIVKRKCDGLKTKLEGKYFKMVEGYLKGVACCLSFSLVSDKHLEDQDYVYFQNHMKELKDKRTIDSSDNLLKLCEKETAALLGSIDSSVGVRNTLIHLFLYIKSQYCNLLKVDRQMTSRLMKLFGETLISQFFDNYLQLKKYKNSYTELVFSLEVEFTMLWVVNFLDSLMIEKAKRIRELTLEQLASHKIGDTDYLKTLKAYLRGCKLRYSYLLMI